jgi:hypothetical protein
MFTLCSLLRKAQVQGPKHFALARRDRSLEFVNPHGSPRGVDAGVRLRAARAEARLFTFVDILQGWPGALRRDADKC